MSVLADALPDASEDELARVDELFPDAECPLEPCGGWIILQDRMVLSKTKGGVLLSNLSQEDQQLRQTAARVAKVGPIAGWDELGGGQLPSWPWFEVGDFVKVSPHSTTRSSVDKDTDKVIFRQVHYKDVLAKIISVREVLR